MDCRRDGQWVIASGGLSCVPFSFTHHFAHNKRASVTCPSTPLLGTTIYGKSRRLPFIGVYLERLRSVLIVASLRTLRPVLLFKAFFLMPICFSAEPNCASLLIFLAILYPPNSDVVSRPNAAIALTKNGRRTCRCGLFYQTQDWHANISGPHIQGNQKTIDYGTHHRNIPTNRGERTFTYCSSNTSQFRFHHESQNEARLRSTMSS